MNTKLVTILIAMTLSSQATAGLFGPSTYDDCILDGVKEAKTELAVKAVYQSCRNKFPKEVANREKSPPKLVEPCGVYWTGREFKMGSTAGDDSFERYSYEYHGVEVSIVAIPKTMAQALGIGSLGVGSNPNESKKFAHFIETQWNNIAAICNLGNIK
jgi:hypothetical protein